MQNKLRSPNSWSCLITSFAIVLKCSVAKLVRLVGHDGSKVQWPELKEPNCRRGFHIQEMIDCAWALGYAVTAFEAMPALMSSPDSAIIAAFTEDFARHRFMRQIFGGCGVLAGVLKNGNRHAIASIKGEMWCPSTYRYIDSDDFIISTFYCLSDLGIKSF